MHKYTLLITKEGGNQSRFYPTFFVLEKMLINTPFVVVLALRRSLKSYFDLSNGRRLIPLNLPRLEYLVGNVC